jgi:signal transduction histidine kinase
VFGDIPNLMGRDFAEVLHLLWPVDYATLLVERFRNTLETGVSYVSPQVSEEGLARRRATYSEWQIHRIPLPDGRYGIVCYFRDISPQTHARIALLDQRRQLEEADRQKDQFLAMLAHELRNPLAPIRNAGELLARLIPDDSRAQPMVGMIKRQVTQLTRLVDDLLDVSRITRGRIDLKFGIVDLEQVVSQALETVDGLLKGKQQKVTLVVSPRPLCVNGDLARLVQCVVNVLANAAKYTDVGGEIHIVTRASGALAVIEISDTGVGIPADLLPQIFDLFVQGDRTLDRAQGGLGIGLSVVKGLIGMHGGQVHARSEGFGKGSSFTLSLPLAASALPAASDSPPASTPPRAILLVDDNVDAANSLAALLSLDGHRVVVAYGAYQALEHLAGFVPDVALLDIGLPEMDGYELARRIRTLPQLEQLRLLALTGYGQEEDRRRAVAAGFDGHLVKPVDIQALTRALGG